MRDNMLAPSPGSPSAIHPLPGGEREKRLDAPFQHNAHRIALTILAAFAILLLAGPLVRLPYWTELPNEGWNAIHALHAFTPALYPAQPAWIVNNYPPLWFYLTGALGALTGDPILAGRAVALAAFFATSFAIFAMLRRMGASHAAALLGALTFAIIVAGLLGAYVGLSEPQMLAHAFVTSSVALAIGARTRRMIAIAALGVVAGIFVKPIVVALPLAATLWLFIHRRHLVATWIAIGALASMAALAACIAGYGTSFIANLTFPRILTLERLGTNFALTSKAVVPLIAFAWMASRRGLSRDPAFQFAALAIIAALFEILMFGAAIGVSINIAFDLVIAASLGVGLVYDRLAEEARGMRWRMALIVALIARVALGMPNPLRDLQADGRDALRAQQADVAQVVARLAPLQGPVACEALAACAWAGHPSEADLWKFRFDTALRSLDTKAFLDAVKTGRFAAIVTYGNFASPADDRNLPGLYDALGAWYEPPLKAGSSFLIFLRKPR